MRYVRHISRVSGILQTLRPESYRTVKRNTFIHAFRSVVTPATRDHVKQTGKCRHVRRHSAENAVFRIIGRHYPIRASRKCNGNTFTLACRRVVRRATRQINALY